MTMKVSRALKELQALEAAGHGELELIHGGNSSLRISIYATSVHERENDDNKGVLKFEPNGYKYVHVYLSDA